MKTRVLFFYLPSRRRDGPEGGSGAPVRARRRWARGAKEARLRRAAVGGGRDGVARRGQPRRHLSAEGVRHAEGDAEGGAGGVEVRLVKIPFKTSKRSRDDLFGKLTLF